MNRRTWLRNAAILAAGLSLRPAKALATWQDTFPLRRRDFGPEFYWGVATAAYQIEGAHDADGKGPSVWDTFTHRSGKIKDKSNGDVACDFYHRYAQDLDLVQALGIPDFRFSIAWSRLIPEGSGGANQAGIDFYDRLIDACLERNITPWVTCYHWDLPQALEDRGGWANRETLKHFLRYCELLAKKYGDRVRHWMVLNEPMAFVGLGYMLGMHAPGRRSPGKFLAATHHAALAQAEGARALRSWLSPAAQVGSTFSAAWMDPWREEKEADQRAVTRADALFNRLFIEPALGMGYPVKDLPFLRRMEKHFEAGDEERLRADFDFVGLQTYTRERIRRSLFPPFIWAKMIPPKKRGLPEDAITDMNWEVYPEGIYRLLKKWAAYPDVPNIVVTENGAAFPDTLTQGRVADPLRTAYLQAHVQQVHRAQQEGVPVRGYFIWTLLDNFEWAEGYRPRFGIVHTDFATQARTIKDSGHWYSAFLKDE